MERRKASPEQLNMLLHFLDEDKELAIGKFTGLEGRIRQTNAWIKITEKLNANSGFGSGAIKTPDKWQQTWRDWKSNVKKKAFKIRKNRFTPGCNANTQLTEAEEKILRLICTNTSVFGLSGVPETSAVTNTMVPSQSTGTNDDICSADPSTSSLVMSHRINPLIFSRLPTATYTSMGKYLKDLEKWPSDSQHFTTAELEMSLGDGVGTDPDAGMGPNEVSSAPVTGKPLWKKGRPVRLVHDRLLNLEEERVRIEKQKLLEKKRCNNIRLKMEKDRLEIERQRNVLLEKLLVAVETVAHR